MTKQSNSSLDLKQTANSIFNQNSPIVETVNMISKGIIPGIPKEITIRAIQRKDKKKILMSETDDVLLSLLQSAIISPTNFNVYDLLPFESEYLLYRLRILTYGSNHTFKHTCPHCGSTNDVEGDLNVIPIKDIPDDFTLIFNISLPVSGDIITCKLLNEGERIAVSKKGKELKENTNNLTAEIDVLWESRIISINEQQLAPIEITQYLDNLNDYDSEYLMEYYKQYEGNYGLQKTLYYNCDKCNKKLEFNMPSIYTFFRPTFEIPKF